MLGAGFFASSEAEAQARGEPPPKKKTKTETMDEFMASIAEDVRGMEERDQAEAEEAAVDRSNKEAFEQKWVSLSVHAILSPIDHHLEEDIQAWL